MHRYVREALFIGVPPVVVLLAGVTTLSGSHASTEASGETTTGTTGLADASSLVVYGAALAVLALVVLVRRRAWRNRER